MEKDQIANLIAEREQTHGRFGDTAETAQELKAALCNRKGWHRMNLTQREALDMICSKLARLVNGNPNWSDSVVDIVGYLCLAWPEAFDGGEEQDGG